MRYAYDRQGMYHALIVLDAQWPQKSRNLIEDLFEIPFLRNIKFDKVDPRMFEIEFADYNPMDYSVARLVEEVCVAIAYRQDPDQPVVRVAIDELIPNYASRCQGESASEQGIEPE